MRRNFLDIYFIFIKNLLKNPFPWSKVASETYTIVDHQNSHEHSLFWSVPQNLDGPNTPKKAIRITIFDFLLCSRILMDHNRQKVLSVLTYLELLFHIPSVKFLTYLTQVSVNNFLSPKSLLFEKDSLLLKAMRIVSYIRNGNLMPKKWQKRSEYWLISIFLYICLKTTALNSSINVWIDTVTLLHDSYFEPFLILFLRTHS